MTVKTTLVAGAPWPPKDAPVAGGTPVKAKAKAKQTDKNFEKWAKKKKDALITGADLGLSIKQEIKQKVKKAEVYKRPDLAPKEFFIFQKAKASK